MLVLTMSIVHPPRRCHLSMRNLRMEFLKEPSQEPATLTSSTDPGLSQRGWWNLGMLVKSLAGPEAAALHHSRQFVIGSLDVFPAIHTCQCTQSTACRNADRKLLGIPTYEVATLKGSGISVRTADTSRAKKKRNICGTLGRSAELLRPA